MKRFVLANGRALLLLSVLSVSIATWYVRKSRVVHISRDSTVNTSIRAGISDYTKSFGDAVKHKIPSILCLILATGSRMTKLKAVNDTWVKRCDKHLFVFGRNIKRPLSDATDILKLNVTEGKEHLTGKVRQAFEFIYDKYNDTFDWIIKADDDTFVIMENLRHLLSNIKPRTSAYLGYHMQPYVHQGYMSGGAGYVISSSALRHLVELGFKKGACNKDGGFEDVEIGKCLQAAGVPILRSRDINGLETFHAESLGSYLMFPFPDWLKKYAWNAFKFEDGGCCSNYSITFHHLSEREIYAYEHLLYRTLIHGESRQPETRRVFLPIPETNKTNI